MGLYLLFSSICLKSTIEKLSQLDTDGVLRTLKIERLYYITKTFCICLHGIRDVAANSKVTIEREREKSMQNFTTHYQFHLQHGKQSHSHFDLCLFLIANCN